MIAKQGILKGDFMRVSVDINLQHIINAISQMSLDEIEKIKDKIIEREVYFKKFKKDNIEDIVADFQQEGYSKEFLSELENGLKKSSVYNED